MDVNKIVLCSEDFGEDLYPTLISQLKILLQAREVCVVKEEEKGILVIEHDHDDYNDSMIYGNPVPVWMTLEEYDEFKAFKSQKEINDQ